MGRAPSINGRKEEPIKELRERHNEVLRLIALGLENKDIAQHLGVTPQMVCNVRNSRVGRVKLKELSEDRDEETADIAETIKALAPMAVSVLDEVMSSPDSPAATRVNAAKDLLDRAGHGSVKRVSLNGRIEHRLSEDQIEDMKERAKLVRMERALTVQPAGLPEGALVPESQLTIDVKVKEAQDDCSQYTPKV